MKLILQVQYAPTELSNRAPSALVSKGFALSPGKINLEVNLERDTFYHGERISGSVKVSNNSTKTIKCFKVAVVQHCEVSVINAQFTREVASMQTKEGCPITPGTILTKQFFLTPVAGDNKRREGVALDGRVRVSIVYYSTHIKRPNTLNKLILSYLG
jgi:arrestin-2